MMISRGIARYGVLCIALAACSDSAFSPETPEEIPGTCSAVREVVISPSTVTLGSLGASAQLTATAYDESGDAVTGANMSWQSLNTAIATVTSAGRISAKSVGSVLVVATAGACLATDTVAVSVTQVVNAVDVSPPSTSVSTGSTVDLDAEVLDSLGNPVQGASVTWTSSNTAVATVNGSGTVSALAAGSATIRAMSSGKAGTAALTVSGVSSPPPTTPPPTTPPPTGGSIIAASNFDNGLLAPFVTGGGTASNADVFVGDDPTGKLSGKVAHLRFERASTAASVDVNRAFKYIYNSGVGLGQTVFLSGEVVIPAPPTSMARAMRKLIYVQRNPNDVSFAVLKADGTHLKAEITNNRVFSGGDIQFDTKVSLEVQITVNSSPGVADGIFRVWKNGTLVIDASNVEWLTSSTPFTRFLFGQQTQHQLHDGSVLFDEMRYWDNVVISTTRVTP